MLKSEHRVWAWSLYRPYVRMLLGRHFASVRLVTPLPGIGADRGLLVTPNHGSWWDGFLVEYAMRSETDREGHVMMLERQLRKYWFFRKIGAFSIRPGDSESVEESLGWASALLEDPTKYVIVFPQGELVSHLARPVVLRTGVSRMLGMSDGPVTVVPAGIHISWGKEMKPHAWVRFGRAIEGSMVASDVAMLAEAFEENLDMLAEDVVRDRYERTLLPT